MRLRLLLVYPILCGSLWACAAPLTRRAFPAPGQGPVPGHGRTTAGRDLSGTWDWVFRSANDQGDMRIEQEEWHLDQKGALLSGYYDRQVMIVSSDQRPFRCNGALSYTKSSRIRVTGRIAGAAVSVQEVAADAQPGPCDSGARNLMEYRGELRGDTLLLHFLPAGTQYLTRRPPGAPMTSLAGAATSADPGAAAPVSVSVPVDGVWEWELRTVDADGDLRTEQEEWHLSEGEAEITGYYDRKVQRVRQGGAFACNGAAALSTVTRYTIKGQRFGDRLALSEVDYKAQPGPCDNALRRLDSYHGAVSPSGQELVLSWGSGNQVLKKRR